MAIDKTKVHFRLEVTFAMSRRHRTKPLIRPACHTRNVRSVRGIKMTPVAESVTCPDCQAAMCMALLKMIADE